MTRAALPLYKYLSVEGARLTLGNGRFRHAKPSTFNDTEDLTVRSIFPEDDETALAIIEESFINILVKNLDKRPTCGSERMRQQIAEIQGAFKASPRAVDAVREAKKSIPSVFDLDHMKQLHEAFVVEINAFMQGFRILCVSARKDSEQMWERYADGHTGIVLSLSPNIEKDSKFQQFRPVKYQSDRPTLYESAGSFLEESLFGDQAARSRIAMDKVVYAKTLDWQYENEYRLAIPVLSDGDWDTLPFHADEISEIYLGDHASDGWKAEVIALAQAINPAIVVFAMFRNGNGRLASRYHF